MKTLGRLQKMPSTPYEQLAFILSELPKDSAKAVAQLQNKELKDTATQLLMSGISDCDMLDTVDVLTEIFKLDESILGAILSQAELTDILSRCYRRSLVYTPDACIFLQLLIDLLDARTVHRAVADFALDTATGYFTKYAVQIAEAPAVPSVTDVGDDSANDLPFLDMLSYYCDVCEGLIVYHQASILAYLQCLLTRAQPDGATAGLYTALVHLIHISYECVLSPLRSASAVTYCVAALTVFSHTDIAGAAAQSSPCMSILRMLLVLLERNEETLSASVLAAILHLVLDKGYPAITCGTISAFLSACHTFLGGGARISTGITSLINRLGESKYESPVCEILLNFLKFCASSDVRIAKIMCNHDELVRWANSKLASVNLGERETAKKLAETIVSVCEREGFKEPSPDAKHISVLRRISEGRQIDGLSETKALLSIE